MNRLIPTAGNGLGVLLSVALLTAGWDLPIAAADQGTPVVADNCGWPTEVKPEHICFL